MGCTYPVYDVSRYRKWPHMGPCGAEEPHQHGDDSRGCTAPTPLPQPPAHPEGDEMIKIVSTGLGDILVIATDADLPVTNIDATLFSEDEDADLADKIGEAVAQQLKQIWGVA